MVSKGKCFVNIRASAVFVERFEGPFGPISQDLGHSILIGMACTWWERVSLLQNSKPYPTVELRCDSKDAVRFPLYLCINTR